MKERKRNGRKEEKHRPTETFRQRGRERRKGRISRYEVVKM
jgi:hypothetical protein